MAWKKYKDMSAEEKKKSWERFRASAKSNAYAKALEANRSAKHDKHPSDHQHDPNPGGYCNQCGYGRDHS